MSARRLLNRMINALPFEQHILGYHFCGLSTRLEKRLDRGDQEINLLDAACRVYDITFLHSNELADRHATDNILAEKTRKRITVRFDFQRERERERESSHSSLASYEGQNEN